MYDEQAEKGRCYFRLDIMDQWSGRRCLFIQALGVSPQSGNALCYIFLEPEFTYSCDVKRHHTVSKLAEAKISQSCCKAVRSDETKVRKYSETEFLSIFFC